MTDTKFLSQPSESPEIPVSPQAPDSVVKPARTDEQLKQLWQQAQQEFDAQRDS